MSRPHVNPDQAAVDGRRIRRNPNLVFEVAFGRLGRHVDAVAVDVEFPAMVDAANAALLIATEVKRGAAVRTVSLDDADFVVGVAKGDQILAEQAQANGRAIWIGQLVTQHRGQPEAAKQFAHRRSRPDTTREFVIFFA
jgi:hypothetical protein